MSTFNHEDTYRWFEQRGVPLVTQDDECVFPKAQDSHVVMDCLTRQATRLGVTICCRSRLTGLTQMEDGRWQLAFQQGFSPHIPTCYHHNRRFAAGHVGLAYLAELGHTIEPPVPSLFTFNIRDKAFLQPHGNRCRPLL